MGRRRARTDGKRVPVNERRAGGAMDVRVSGRGGSRDGNKEERREGGKKEQIVKIKERKGSGGLCEME